MIADTSGELEDQAIAVGRLILQMVQPGATFRNPDEDRLQHPERCSNDLLEFHKAALTMSVHNLRQVRLQRVPYIESDKRDS